MGDRAAGKSSMYRTGERIENVNECICWHLLSNVTKKRQFRSPLLGAVRDRLVLNNFIPIDSSLDVLSKVFWVQFDQIKRSAEILNANSRWFENSSARVCFFKLTGLLLTLFHLFLYQSIALWTLYHPSFGCNSIGTNVVSLIVTKRWRGSSFLDGWWKIKRYKEPISEQCVPEWHVSFPGTWRDHGPPSPLPPGRKNGIGAAGGRKKTQWKDESERDANVT